MKKEEVPIMHLLILLHLVLGKMFLGSEFVSLQIELLYGTYQFWGMCLEDCELGDLGHHIWPYKVYPTPESPRHRVLGPKVGMVRCRDSGLVEQFGIMFMNA